MKLVLAAAVALGALTASVTASSAMSIGTPASGASSLVQDVRWGCGPGWHPNPWGRCVPNRRPVYFYGGGYGHHWGGGGWGGGWHNHRRRW